MRVYFNEDERCEECGSDNVITKHDKDGSTYDECKDCGHKSYH